MAGIAEGQRADEQAHGEADAAQQGDGDKLIPARVARLGGEFARHGKDGGGEDAERLAEQPTEEHAEGHRLEQPRQAKAVERPAGIGECEQRQDDKDDPRVQALLELLEQRGLAGTLAG